MRAALRLSRGTRRRSAFTLIEVTIVIAILSVALGLFAQTMVASARIDPVSEETRVAAEAARMELEDMRALDFARIFASYNANPADDPAGDLRCAGPDQLGPADDQHGPSLTTP